MPEEAAIPVTVIENTQGRSAPREVLGEYLEFLPLLRYLAARDWRLRYRHASLGTLWVILQPLLPMLVFTVVFAKVLRPSTGAIPYSLYALAGLVPWSFFSSTVSRACLAFVSNANLLNKVYFPRAILPASSVLGGVVDLAVGCALVCGYAIFNGYWPGWRWLALPACAALTLITAFFVSLLLATLNAVQRDVKHAMQFLMQLWLYASPVVYPAALVPEQYRWLLALNPMTAVLESFRWSLFGSRIDPWLFPASLAATGVIALAAVRLFRRFERTLAERV